MEAQEVATCCRGSWSLMAGREGPRFAQVSLDTLFVRDQEFMEDLARDMAKNMIEVGMGVGEMMADNKRANNENAEKRRLRGEALKVASDVVDVMRHLRKCEPHRWAMFQKMIRKQTLRQIVRREKTRNSMSIAEDIQWCSDYIVGVVGAERLEILLTLRAMVA